MRSHILRFLLAILSITAALLVPLSVHGGGPVVAEGPQVITKTVLVPQVAYKTIAVPGYACKPEVRQATVQACRLVPETKMVTALRTVVEPQRKTWTEHYTACRMTFETVERQVTQMVPHRQLRQGVRTVCKLVQAQAMQTVCRDLGQWTSKSYVDAAGCTQTCQVWQPNIVTEQVPVTVWKPQFVQEPYQYEEIVCKPVVRNVVARVPRPVFEPKTREVSCIVPVCRLVQQEVPCTSYRAVVEPKVVNYTAMVSVPVTRQVTVPVCTLVPKTVTCVVCGPSGCR
jgi:hypothetical protein